MTTDNSAEARDSFAPCPLCHQWSHSLGADQVAEALLHFESMVAHPVRGHPMDHHFDEQTRAMAQVLVAAARSAEQNTELRLAAVSEAAPVSGGEMPGREVLGPHATLIDEDGEDGFKPVAALVGSMVCVEQAGHMIAMSRATARKLVEVLSEGLGDAEQLAFERQERADWGDLHRLQQRGPNLVKPRLGGHIVRWAADEIAAFRSAR